jgi:hypothetical protein
VDILTFKWGTVPPLVSPNREPIRAFGQARAQVIEPDRFVAACSAAGLSPEEDPALFLRSLVISTLEKCPLTTNDDLSALNLLAKEQAVPAFQAIGLELLEIEIQSWQIAETQLDRVFHDPAPDPLPKFSITLSPGMLLGNFAPPVEDFELPMALPAAAAYARLDESSLLLLVQEGKIPAVQVDNEYYIHPSDLDLREGSACPPN